VIRRLDLRGRADLDRSTVRELLPRAELDVDAALDAVRLVCADVRERGAAAVAEHTLRLDGVAPPSLRVPADRLEVALSELDGQVRSALDECIRRVRIAHGAQQPTDRVTEVVPGGTVTQRWRPVSRVGLYVPGGRAVYPSSVVMNVVPAQVAGVGSLAVCSPPQRDSNGWPAPAVLAACAALGVDEVYAVGGAQAIAMLAYGVEGCPAVDVVSGPGNAYVAAAKRLVRGVVGIDAEAGPTEIAILADDSADPGIVAADLISQAEHDPAAAGVLVTTDARLADDVTAQLASLVAATKHQERIRAALVSRQSAVVLVDDLAVGIAVVDAYAAEHLEIHTRDARAVADRISSAGAIFVGPWAPVSLGDYLAGSNHVLPTGGVASHSSGLSVYTFLRSGQVVEYDRPALRAAAAAVGTLADAEDLPAHGAAVFQRFAGGVATDEDAPAETSLEVPIRPDLRGVRPYGAPQLDLKHRLNTNENPYPVPPGIREAMAQAVLETAATINRYPDREAVALRADLAVYLSEATGVDLHLDQIWVGNGSNEVLLQLLLAFGGPGRAALGFEPSYTMHRTLARTTGTDWVAGERDAGFDVEAAAAVELIRSHRPAITFLTTPNNPTGTSIPMQTIEAIYDAAQQHGPSIVVVDEAYAEFAGPSTRSAVELLAGRPYLVVTRTLSKAFRLAGARIGYLAADQRIIDALRLVRLPYHVSAVTQAIGRAALAYRRGLLAAARLVAAERDRLAEELATRGMRYTPSDANFLLVAFRDAPAAWQALVDRGVLVRDVGLPDWLRVSVGTNAEVDGLLAALDDLLANRPELLTIEEPR
jgi:histidinol dehydrogenase